MMLTLPNVVWNPFFWFTWILFVALLLERIKCLKKIAEIQSEFDKALEATRADYEQRLKILQEAKNVVWIKAEVQEKSPSDIH